MHNDIVDYFYYCQLRTQGEDSMEDRAITGRIPLSEIPSLVRAVGYYPSEEEVTNMINEVRYSTYMEDSTLHEDIGLNDFIKLYVNHRPVLPLNSTSISAAFASLVKAAKGTDGQLDWAQIREMLVCEGEAIAAGDLESYLTALIGDNAKYLDGQNNTFDASSFADEVLGFEDM